MTKASKVTKEMEAYGITHNQMTFPMIMVNYVQLGDIGNVFVVSWTAKPWVLILVVD
jgi:hypothetical protein